MKIAYPKVFIELRPSRITGVGVFAVSNIAQGQRIAEGIADEDHHQLIPWTRFDEFDQAVRKKIDDFCVGTPEGFIPPEDLDFNRLSIEWYFNHSCDGNVGFDDRGDFVARTRIRKGEELTYDYALAESNPRFRMVCRCGSANCRGVITGDDWKDPSFRRKNYAYMLPRLKRAELPTGRAESFGVLSRNRHAIR